MIDLQFGAQPQGRDCSNSQNHDALSMEAQLAFCLSFRRLAIMLVFASACSPDDAVTPAAGSPTWTGMIRATPETHPASQIPSTLDDNFEAIDRDFGGFGGMFYQESGRLAMYLKPGTNLAGAIQVARAHLPKTRGLSDPISVFPARFTYSELTAWREVVNADGVDRSGLILDDIDERRNQLLFGVESPEAGARLRRALVDRGVPDEAIVTEVRELPRLIQTVTDSTNPVIGGIYVKGDTLSGCTMGFNAKWNGVMHFVTASHCTTNLGPPAQTYKYLGMGVLTGVLMCQPTCDDSARWAPFQSKLGPEVLDPPYQNTPGYWGSLCASDELCRMADAALIRYDYRIPTVYQIVSATSTNPGNPLYPPIVLGAGTVVGETIGNNQLVGSYAYRTGISTGFNFGQISQTCFHVRTYPRPNNKMLKLVCQNEMGSNAEPGDSGGPVYYSDASGIYLYGIVWGGRIGYTWYSPINNILTDFGPYYSWQTY